MTQKKLTISNVVYPESICPDDCPIGIKSPIFPADISQRGKMVHRLFYHFMEMNNSIIPDSKVLSGISYAEEPVADVLYRKYIEGFNSYQPPTLREDHYPEVQHEFNNWLHSVARQTAHFTEERLQNLLDESPVDVVSAPYEPAELEGFTREMDGILKSWHLRVKELEKWNELPFCTMERRFQTAIPYEQDAEFNLVGIPDYVSFRHDGDKLKIDLFEVKVRTGRKISSLKQIESNKSLRKYMVQLGGQMKLLQTNKNIERLSEKIPLNFSANLLFLHWDPEDFYHVGIPNPRRFMGEFSMRMWDAWELKKGCYERCDKTVKKDDEKQVCEEEGLWDKLE